MNLKYTMCLAAGIVLVSCGNNYSIEKTEETIAFTTIEREQTFRLEKSAADYNVDEDLLFSCEARLVMPTALGRHNIDSLRSEIMSLAFGTVTDGTETLIEDAFRAAASAYGYDTKDTTVVSGDYDGTFVVEGNVAGITPVLMTYAVTVSKYDPYAAHGMYGVYYLNYSIEDGTVVGLRDIITPEGLAQLPSLLAQKARMMRDIIGRTVLKALPSDDNFYTDLRGNIVFVYQPYEIASFAQGVIEIPLAAYRISDLLTPLGKRLLLDVDTEESHG